MQSYFEQLRTRLTGPPVESPIEMLDLLRKIENSYEEYSQKLTAKGISYLCFCVILTSIFILDMELNLLKQHTGELSTLDSEMAQLRKQLEESNSQRNRYLEVMNSQQNELDRLHEEIKQLNSSLDSMSVAKNEALGKICDLESSKFSIDYRLNQQEIEVDQLQRQLAWTKEQLQIRSNDLEDLRRSSSIRTSQLENELASLKTELEVSEKIQVESQRAQQEQHKTILDLTAKLQEAQMNFTTMEQRYTAELQAMERRDRLNRESLEDDQSRITAFSEKIAEFENQVKIRDEKIMTLLNEHQKATENMNKVLQEKERRISEINRELENANQLLAAAKKIGIPLGDSDVEPLSPAAVVATRLAKSGLSITQMYTKFLDISNACQLKDVELNGLKEILSKVQDELMKKGPEMKRQREELDAAKREVIGLREQLESSVKERNRLQRVIRDRDDKMVAFERERSSLRFKCSDLSRQVQSLLHRVEVAEGRRQADDEDMVSSSGVSAEDTFQNSAEFISKKLVEFGDITELQQQNERLLALIRELSSDKEADEERQKKLADLEEQLTRSKTEYDQLQTAHRHAQELLSAVTQQRDSFKMLVRSPQSTVAPDDKSVNLNDSTQVVVGSANVSTVSFGGAPASTPRPLTINRVASTSSVMGSPVRSVNEKMLAKVEEELSTAKKRLQERDDELQQLKRDISNLRIELTEQKANAGSLQNQLKVAEHRAEAARREADNIQAKSSRQDALCAQLENSLSSLNSEVESKRAELRSKDNEFESFKREIDNLRSTNVQLTAERDSLRRTEQHTTMLLASMESIKRTVGEESREDRRRLMERTTDLERQLAQARQRLDEETRRRSELVKQLERELGSVQKQLATEQEAHQRTQNALTAATSALDPDADAAQQDLERRKLAEQLQSENTELRLELDEHKKKVKLLEEEKRQIEARQTELSDFSGNLESTLTEQKAVVDDLTRQLRELQRQFDDQTADFDALRSQSEADRIKIETERDEAYSRAETQKTELEASIEELKQQAAEMAAERTQLLSEKEQWTSVIAEAEGRYGREVQLHAASITELNNLRGKLTEMEKKVTGLERDKADMASRLSDSDHRVTEIEAQAEAAKSEADGFRQQLHTLLENTATTTGAAMDTDQQQAASQEDSGKSVELVRFLRRERALLQSRLDVSEANESRARTMITMLQREVADLRSSLNAERKAKQALEASPAKAQQELKSQEYDRRLESLNSMLDASKLLREDRDKLEAELKSLKEKYKNDQGNQGVKSGKVVELTRQLEVAAAERKAAQDDAERWRQRVQSLMEQMKRSEIDELKKAASERDSLRALLNTRVEQIKKSEQELIQVRKELAEAKNENSTLKQTGDASSSVVTGLKEQLAKSNEVNAQLRKIAQKYKQQFIEADKQIKALQGGGAAAGTSTATDASQQDSAKLKEMIAGLEVSLASAKSQGEETQKKLADAERERTTSNSEVLQLKKQLEEMNKKYSDLNRQCTTFRLETQQHQQENEDLKSNKVDMERRQLESQKTYSELQSQFENLERENRDLREALRHGSTATPGSSGATVTTATLPTSAAVTAPVSSATVTSDSCQLQEHGNNQHNVAVSPAAVVHPRLRCQQTATVAPTTVHAVPSRLAPPAPIPPMRVWPQQRPEPETEQHSSQDVPGTSGIQADQQRSSSPSLGASSSEPPASEGARINPQKRPRQQSSVGEGSAVVGSTSDSLASQQESEEAKRRRTQQQQQQPQSVAPFQQQGESEQVMSEDDLLLDSTSQPHPESQGADTADEQQHEEEEAEEGEGEGEEEEGEEPEEYMEEDEDRQESLEHGEQVVDSSEQQHDVDETEQEDQEGMEEEDEGEHEVEEGEMQEEDEEIEEEEEEEGEHIEETTEAEEDISEVI